MKTFSLYMLLLLFPGGISQIDNFESKRACEKFLHKIVLRYVGEGLKPPSGLCEPMLSSPRKEEKKKFKSGW